MKRVQWGPDQDTVVCEDPNHGSKVIILQWHKDDFTTGWICYPEVIMGPLPRATAVKLRDALIAVLDNSEEEDGVVSARNEETDQTGT